MTIDADRARALVARHFDESYSSIREPLIGDLAAAFFALRVEGETAVAREQQACSVLLQRALEHIDGLRNRGRHLIAEAACRALDEWLKSASAATDAGKSLSDDLREALADRRSV